jgi:hypothetical protein
MSHTKEPWIAVGKRIKQDLTIIGLSSDAGVTIGSASGGSTSGPYFVENDEEVAANARRIVACVNALSNVSTEWLESNKSIVVLGAPIADRFREVEQQRDELLAALEDMLSGWQYIREVYGDLRGVGFNRAENKAVAAIAKATGYQNPSNSPCMTT